MTWPSTPLLPEVADGARWAGTDDYPAFRIWADEHEAWRQFVKAAGGWGHYLPRLRGPKESRDEALAEIATAYFLAVRCGLSLLKWGASRVEVTKDDMSQYPIEVHRGRVVADCGATRTADDLVRFLERLAVRYPSETVHVMWPTSRVGSEYSLRATRAC